MGFLAEWKRDRAVARAAEALLGGDAASAAKVLGPFEADGDGVARVLVALRLREKGAEDLARGELTRVLARRPAQRGALLLLAEMDADAGRPEEAVSHLRRLLAASPRDVRALESIAGLLLGAGRVGDALDVLPQEVAATEPALALARARALRAAGRTREALEAARALVEELRRGAERFAAARTNVSPHELEMLLAQLHDEAPADADEAPGSRARDLGPLLPSRERASLAPVEAAPAEVAGLRAAGAGADALVVLAETDLRCGRVADARASFEQALDLAPRHAGAAVGLSLALAAERGRHAELAGRLPEVAEPRGLATLVPGLGALTPLERRVVCCLAEPFAAQLPALAASGARLDLVPFGGRDEEGEDALVAHLRSEEPSGLACRAHAQGASSARGAVSVHALIDVASPRGLAFAHELAHLVHGVLPHATLRRLEALHARAAEVEHACTLRQVEDPVEYLAYAVTDALRLRHALPLLRERDDEGVLEEAARFAWALASAT